MLESLTKRLVKTKILEGTIDETPENVGNNPNSSLTYLGSFMSGVGRREEPHYHVKTNEGMEKVPAGSHNFGLGATVTLKRNYYLGIIPGKPILEKRENNP